MAGISGLPPQGATANLGGTIQTVELDDDVVTLAKMAAGTAGNLITYDASGNPAAVATGTAAQVLTSGGAGAAPTFQTLAASGKCTFLETDELEAGDFTTTSTTFVDVTNATITATTGANRVLLFYTGTWYESSTDTGCLDFDIDGAREGNDNGLIQANGMGGVSRNVCLVHISKNALTAASHTFKLQAKTTAGTLYMTAATTSVPITFTAVEIA